MALEAGSKVPNFDLPTDGGGRVSSHGLIGSPDVYKRQSSDIDLIVLFDEETMPSRLAEGPMALTARLTRALVHILEHKTKDGYCLSLIHISRLRAGMPVVELFQLAGLVTTNGEARRLIRAGGARLNDAIVQDETLSVTIPTTDDATLKLSSGKKRHVLVLSLIHI